MIVALDAHRWWNRDWFSPKHLLDDLRMLPGTRYATKALTLENTKNTEENVLVSFVVSKHKLPRQRELRL